MVPADGDRFLAAISTLQEVFGKILSDPVLKIYSETLKSYSIEEVENAISQAIGKLKYFPKPAELIEFMGGNVSDKAEVECAKAFRAISAVGSYESVCFDDPITQAVIKQGFGGWVKFCTETMEADKHFRKKDFVKLYASFSRSNMKCGGYLAGISETQNSAAGIEREPQIKLIGDPDKCKQVKMLTTGKEYLEIGNFDIGSVTKQITG